MKNKRWVNVVLWPIALLFLLGTIVYFNVFAKRGQVSLIHVGMECPDFTLQQYRSKGTYFALTDETFTLSEQRGSVVVINFWATWCGPCVAELPFFNQVANEYPEAKIVAIHGSSTEDVGRFITRKTGSKASWQDYRLDFLQDEVDGETCMTYQMLGGNSAWPMTLIVDKEGKISYIKQGSMTYNKLKEEVEKALAK